MEREKFKCGKADMVKDIAILELLRINRFLEGLPIDKNRSSGLCDNSSLGISPEEFVNYIRSERISSYEIYIYKTSRLSSNGFVAQVLKLKKRVDSVLRFIKFNGIDFGVINKDKIYNDSVMRYFSRYGLAYTHNFQASPNNHLYLTEIVERKEISGAALSHMQMVDTLMFTRKALEKRIHELENKSFGGEEEGLKDTGEITLTDFSNGMDQSVNVNKMNDDGPSSVYPLGTTSRLKIMRNDDVNLDPKLSFLPKLSILDLVCVISSREIVDDKIKWHYENVISKGGADGVVVYDLSYESVVAKRVYFTLFIKKEEENRITKKLEENGIKVYKKIPSIANLVKLCFRVPLEDFDLNLFFKHDMFKLNLEK